MTQRTDTILDRIVADKREELAAALVAADLAPDLKEGVRLAARAVDSGAARDKLAAFVKLTGSFA